MQAIIKEYKVYARAESECIIIRVNYINNKLNHTLDSKTIKIDQSNSFPEKNSSQEFSNFIKTKIYLT